MGFIPDAKSFINIAQLMKVKYERTVE